MSDNRLCVFSLNCWGLKYVSKNRVERISAIADFLSSSHYDIICLQELWVFKDYELVRASVSRYQPYSKFFYSGALGAGLAIFSRYPIIAATIQPYSLNGSPLDVKAGDWFVGKAAASVLVAHPILGQIQVFNTHLFAKGGEGGPEHHRAHRLVNAWEFANLAKQSAEIGRYVIAAGDFNSIPSTLPMTVIRDHAGLQDAWESLRLPPDTTQANYVNPQDAIFVYGVTADSPLNSYSAGKPLDAHARISQGKRLDYVLFCNPSPPSSSSSQHPKLVCSDVCVRLTEPIPGRTFSYSDHFGLEATFTIKHPEAYEQTLLSDLSAESVIPSISSVAAPASLKKPRLSSEDTSTVLHALETSLTHSIVRARTEMRIFYSCLVVDFILLFCSGWSTGLSPLFVLLGAIATWLGTTMLYAGFLYGRWEVNALRNVIEELELYRRSVDISADVNGTNQVGEVR